MITVGLRPHDVTDMFKKYSSEKNHANPTSTFTSFCTYAPKDHRDLALGFKERNLSHLYILLGLTKQRLSLGIRLLSLLFEIFNEKAIFLLQIRNNIFMYII